MDLRDRSVSEVMHKEMAVMAPDERLDLADDIMRLIHVRHVPVVEDGRLVGLLSSHDLLAASLAKVFEVEEPNRRTFLRAVDVREVMAHPVSTASPDTTLAEAAELMVKRKISALPVVDRDDTLIGLVTITDLVQAAFLEKEEEKVSRDEHEVEAIEDRKPPRR